MGTQPSKRVWFVRIEGVGNDDTPTVNRLSRWSSAAAPSWDADGHYKHALGAGIGLTAQSIEPRTGQSSSGGMTFSLNVELGDPHGVLSTFGRRFHSPVSSLGADVSAQDSPTDLDLPDTIAASLAEGTIVYINREAIEIGTYAGIGIYNNCIRARLGTTIQRHRELVQVYTDIKVLRARRVTLCYYDDDATSYSDEVEFQSYQLWDGEQVGLVAYNFTCDGFDAVLSEAELFKEQWIAQVLPYSWRDRLGYLNIEHQPDYREGGVVRLPEALRSARTDANGGSADERGGTGADPVAGDTFDVAVNGTIYRALVSVFEADAAGNVTIFKANIDINQTLPYGGTPENVTSTTDPNSLDVREVITSDAGAAGNNGSGTAQLPLGSGSNHHPLAIWLQVVTSTPDGTNGPYDTGIDFGLRLPVSWIDLDAAEKIISTDAEDMRAERFFVGREDDPEEALEKLRMELLHPAGIQRTESTDGRISFTRITDSDYLTAAVAVGEDQLVLAVEMQEQFKWASTLDKLILKYDRNGGGKARRIPVSDNENTEESLGPVDSETIDGGSFLSRDVVLATGIDYLVRWRNELPDLAFATTMDVGVRSGDSVNLTCKAVLGYDRVTEAPIEGVTDSRVLITSRLPDIEGNFIVYTGLHTGVRGIISANVAPSMLITGANTGESVPIDATHFVGTDHLRGYTDDIDPWVVGDSAVVLNVADLSIKESGLVVASLVSGTVVLTGLTVATVSGDTIVPDTFAASTVAQQDRFEFYDQDKQYEG